MSTAATRLQDLLNQPATTSGDVSELLDGLSHAGRMEAIYSLSGPRLQRRLYELGADLPRVTLDQVVPPDATPLREVIYHGKNSLPAFTHFQKRFCRPPKDTEREELWGYNHSGLRWLVGPGYFVVHDEEVGAAIDYRQVPPHSAPGWPDVVPNDQGVSHLVYKNMVDYLRRVSAHAFIGSATKQGKELGNYFVLCREP